jgi:hypothetical protein
LLLTDVNQEFNKMRLCLTLKAPKEGQDNFFLWSMIVLPILAEVAYIFDTYYNLSTFSHHPYAGLFSTLLVVFTYLRYSVPIESTKMLALYYIISLFMFYGVY